MTFESACQLPRARVPEREDLEGVVPYLGRNHTNASSFPALCQRSQEFATHTVAYHGLDSWDIHHNVPGLPASFGASRCQSGRCRD